MRRRRSSKSNSNRSLVRIFQENRILSGPNDQRGHVSSTSKKTTGEQDSWTCVIGDYGCDNWFEWNGDLTSLLAAMAMGRLPAWILEGVAKFPLVFLDLETMERMRLV